MTIACLQPRSAEAFSVCLGDKKQGYHVSIFVEAQDIACAVTDSVTRSYTSLCVLDTGILPCGSETLSWFDVNSLR